ncbi:MAG: PH domain-containing protein [Actinomycetota bacterium]
MARAPGNPFSGLVDGFVRWLDRIAEDGLLRLLWRWSTSWFGRDRVMRKLVTGENVIAHVLHSWIAYVIPVLICVGGVALGVLWLPRVSVDAAWFPISVVAGVLGYGFYKVLQQARDRFVITDSRVYRVWGVFSLGEAEMEIVRVLDVTVNRPWYLRLVGSGHLVLENAAQEQGLREIKYIPRANDLSVEIHRRRRQMMGLMGDEDSGTEPTEHRPPRSQHPRKPRPVTARRHR